MERRRELEHLLRAVLKNDVDPGRLAVAADHWHAASGVDLLTFLIERGALSQDDLHRIMTVGGEPSVQDTQHPSDEAEATTDLPTPGGPAAPAAPGGSTGDAQRYKILRLHQRGGLGEVWVAWDAAVGRQVALKSLRPERVENDSARARFNREAKVTGQLEHPSIVPLYDMGGGERNPFYVMRFVAGRTLAEAAADYHRRRVAGAAGALDLNVLLDAFVNVCQAVAFAHSRNILHRDLKGQNIVLGEYGEVFLLDWGLAKPVGAPEEPAMLTTAEGDSDDGMTAPGAALGTPSFMAPEVARGGLATKASDIYGLGTILYVLLTGRAPFGGSSAADVLGKVMSAPPPPVDAANPSVPPALTAICLKAMARDEETRYASADELATEVRRWLADEPVAAYREPWAAKAARWARRRKTTVVAAAVLLLTAAVASSVAATLVWREQQQTKLAWKKAQEEEQKASENADTAIKVVHDLGEYVRRIETSSGREVGVGRRRAALDATIAGYERLLALNPKDLSVQASVARVYRYRANLCRLLNETSEADRAYKTALTRYRALAAEAPQERYYREELAETSRDYGMLLKLLGRLKDATRLLHEALHTFEQLRQDDPSNLKSQRTVANMLLDQADVEYQLGLYRDAERTALRSAEVFAKLAALPGVRPEPLEPLFWALAENRKAVALRELGQFEEARAAHDAAVNRLTELAQRDQKSVDARFQRLRVRAERGATLTATPARRDAAGADLDAAVQGLEAMRRESPEVALLGAFWEGVSRRYRGDLKKLLGQQAAAIDDLTKSVTLFEELVRKSPNVPSYRFELGRSCLARGRLATDPTDAKKWLTQARSAFLESAQRSPENVQYEKALSDLDELLKKARP